MSGKWIINLMPFKLKSSRIRGFTLLEMIVSIVLGMMALFFIYRFMSNTRLQFMSGTVNLQNLQDARLAINYLRRDFGSSCFLVSSLDAFEDVFLARMNSYTSGSTWATGKKSALINVSPGQISFHRFDFATSPDVATPGVLLTEYRFDPAAKTVYRLDKGEEKAFKGIENCEFKLYCHEANPRIPMLWVKLVVNENEIYGNNLPSNRSLELTTTIASPYVSSNIQITSWNYELPQEEKIK